MSFGSLLKQYRIEHGLSQEEIAKQLGTTRQVICRYEKDQRSPKITIVSEFAKILGLPISYFENDDTLSSIPHNTPATLSPDEEQFLASYRTLSPAGKDYLKEQLSIAERIFPEGHQIQTENIG